MLLFGYASVLEIISVPGLNSGIFEGIVGGHRAREERIKANQTVVEIFMSCSMYLNIPLTTGALDSFSEM